jgi:hypothetical protein
MQVKDTTLIELPKQEEPSLEEVRRLNEAIAEAVADVECGRVSNAEVFMANVQKRWPRKSSV